MSKIKKNADITFKIITLGNAGVGKTSILNRFHSGIFEENTRSTIGIDFSIKQLILKNNIAIKLKLIDTCGQEIYKSITKSYFKNCDGVFFVFALNNKKSFDEIGEWIKLFNENENKNVTQFLVGNKCDIKDRIDTNLIDIFAKSQNIKYIETSAKNNTNIDELFQDIGEILYDIYNKSGIENKSQQIQKLNNKEKKVKKKNCCVEVDI